MTSFVLLRCVSRISQVVTFVEEALQLKPLLNAGAFHFNVFLVVMSPTFSTSYHPDCVVLVFLILVRPHPLWKRGFILKLLHCFCCTCYVLDHFRGFAFSSITLMDVCCEV